MKILLLGAKGQVGWELQRSLVSLGTIKACDRKSVDLEDFDHLQQTVRQFAPDLIVNAAAYTAVDKAETETDRAYRINSEAVALLARETQRLDSWLVHYSTDYVFDGEKLSPYIETDTPNPQSIYGKSKLLGEKAIRESGCRHLIFRTSWVFALHGANFAKTILRLARERDSLRVVADQFGAPTSAELIADVTACCLLHLKHHKTPSESLAGTYHLTASGETSWHGFAQYLIGQMQNLESPSSQTTLQTTPETVHAIATEDYPVAAKRPANSRLNTQKLSDRFDIHLAPWQTHAKRLITQLSTQGKP